MPSFANLCTFQAAPAPLEDYWLCWVVEMPQFPTEVITLEGIDLKPKIDAYVKVQFMAFEMVTLTITPTLALIQTF